MEIATETERKYDVPRDFRLPPLAGLTEVHSAGDGATHELDATYFDTDDLRLARHRRTLRRRTGGEDAGWHLKTPGEGTSRTEHRLPVDGDEVPAPLHAEVRSIVRDSPLRPVARLRTRRVETPLRDADGRTLALVAEDEVLAETDDGEQRWRELEVELVDGGPKVLKAVERRLVAAGAARASGPSKLARALGDRLRQKGTGGRGGDPVLRYTREQRDAIVAYDPGVRHGDAEAVHRMRVATRRLRSTLKTFRDAFPAERAAFVAGELKWLAGQLGEVRDGQVLSGKLLAGVEQDGAEFGGVAGRIRDHLAAKVDAGTRALAQDLDSQRYFTLLDAVDELAEGARRTGDPRRPARKALTKADRLLDTALADGEDAELHEARKAYKRARYAVEVVQATGGRAAKQLVQRLTDLQDVLGAHQDSVVAREVLHELAAAAHADSENAFPYGVLHARQEQVGRDTYAELPLVVIESRRRKLRSWLG